MLCARYLAPMNLPLVAPLVGHMSLLGAAWPLLNPPSTGTGHEGVLKVANFFVMNNAECNTYSKSRKLVLDNEICTKPMQVDMGACEVSDPRGAAALPPTLSVLASNTFLSQLPGGLWGSTCLPDPWLLGVGGGYYTSPWMWKEECTSCIYQGLSLCGLDQQGHEDGIRGGTQSSVQWTINKDWTLWGTGWYWGAGTLRGLQIK